MVSNTVVCGGTFDHFHKGHEKFLNYALSLGGRLIVGLTSDEYVRSAKCKVQSARLIEDYEIRKKSVGKFLAQKKVQDRAEVIEIEDLFGPTLSKDLLIDRIVASDDTKKGADIINQKRRQLGLLPLKVLIAPFVKAEGGKLISSDRIRKGEISRSGKLYVKPSWFKTDLILPEDLRQELKEPLGEMLANVENLPNDKSSLVVTVGDVTTKTFNEKSLGQNISVIDFKVNRKKKFEDTRDLGFVGDENILQADNPAGHISPSLFKKLYEIFQLETENKIILQINGEEDLAVLPSILLSPLNTVIYYGQPNKGLVKVVVSEESKGKAYSLVSKLKPA